DVQDTQPRAPRHCFARGPLGPVTRSPPRLGGRAPQLERYAVKAITGGPDAQGEVSCLLRDGDTVASGQGSHTDIIMASALAYLAALNKLEYLRAHRPAEPQTGP